MEKNIKNNLIDFVKNNWWYIIAPLIVILEIMVVYAIKGVFPFGERTVSYFDMAQSIIPNYYHGYDVLHFNNDINLQWNVSLGTSIANEIGRFVLFPVNIFWYFVKRNDILNSMSIFICIKFALAAFFMEIYSYTRKNNKVLCIIAAVAYSLCGMAIQYYNTGIMLDDILLFPLLIYAFNQLIDNKKKWLYVLCLYFIFTFNQQTIFFVCFFLLMYAFIELKDKAKEEKQTIVVRILVFSLISILCSSYVFIPNILQTMSSSRVAVNYNLMTIFTTILTELQANKNFMLFTSEFVIALIVLILCSKKIKKYYLNIILIVLLMIPIAFEGVNLMWHLGSYQCFPMRFGFMLTFACLDLLLISWNDIDIKSELISKYLPLFSIALLPLMLIIIYKICSYFILFGIRDCEIYKNYWIIVIGLVVFYLGLFVSKNEKIKLILMAIMVAGQTICGAYGFIAPESDMYPESTTDIIFNSIANEQEFSGINGINNRLKDANFNLNANYGFITRTASGSGWVNGTEDSVVKEMIRMGYDSFYIRTLDCGGTALSDLCLGYKYIYDKNYNGSDLYKTIEGKENVYEFNYSTPFGYLIEDDSLVEKSLGFEHQNQIYNALGGEGQLFNVLDTDELEFEYDEELGDYYLELEIDVDDKTEVYLFGSSYNVYDYEIYINGEVIKVPYLFNENNIYFPAYYRNGFLDCGTYENEKVSILFRSLGDTLNGNIMIGLMPFDSLERFVSSKNEEILLNSFEQNKNSLNLNVTSSKAGDYVLPIGYSRNWIIKVNGNKVDYSGVLNGSLISVPINQGDNVIELHYHQRGLSWSISLSILGVALFIICMIFSNKLFTPKYKVVNTLIYCVYIGVTCLGIFVVYVIPLVMNIITMIDERVGLIRILRYF